MFQFTQSCRKSPSLSPSARRQSSRSQLGMTLLEIMIVLAIIAAVMGLLVGPKVMAIFSSSKTKTTKLQLGSIVNAQKQWVLTVDDPCPKNWADLGKFWNEKKIKDSWGQELILICGEAAPDGVEFGVLSKGPDKKQGTSDDLKSWED